MSVKWKQVETESHAFPHVIEVRIRVPTAHKVGLHEPGSTP